LSEKTVCRGKQASELLQKALSLSEEERAELAGSLIESLDATVDEAAEAAWIRRFPAASRIWTPVSEDCPMGSSSIKDFPLTTVR
jgi:hypothetical protein